MRISSPIEIAIVIASIQTWKVPAERRLRFTAAGEKISERQVWRGETRCNTLYPPHANPYIRAGAPLANNVVKCALKPIRREDYAVRFTDAELAELASIFPDGVCDYSRPGVGQQGLRGTWLSFGPAGAPRGL